MRVPARCVEIPLAGHAGFPEMLPFRRFFEDRDSGAALLK
jgi:hypothetical protein